MTDIKLFRLNVTDVTEVEGAVFQLERALQNLFEKNLENLLGVRFLASELTTSNGGRIDTLGLDENNCPVIIEYKRDRHQNVINQGLFYLDWLMDHRRDFEWVVLEKCGGEDAKSVEWGSPRLICIAADFTKYDVHAVNQMNRNIELIRYRQFGSDLLLLDLLTATSGEGSDVSTESSRQIRQNRYRTVTESLEKADPELRERFEVLTEFLIALGDDVQMKTLKNYFAFRRIKNFACVEIHNRSKNLLAFIKVDPSSVTIEKGFTRDVRDIGHFGTGDLEITISNLNDLEKAKPLFLSSYEAS